MARRHSKKRNDDFGEMFAGLTSTRSLVSMAAIAAGVWWLYFRKPKPLLTAAVDAQGNPVGKSINPQGTVDLDNPNALKANSSVLDQVAQAADEAAEAVRIAAANLALNQKGSSGSPGRLPPQPD